MKRICFLVGYSHANGGIARVTSMLANELVKEENYEVFITSFQKTRINTDYHYDKRIKQIQLFDYGISMYKALVFEGAIKKLRNILDEYCIDVLISAGDIHFPLACFSVMGTKTKCYCWEHSDPLNVTDHKFSIQCRKIGAKLSDGIIVLTKAAEKQYAEYYKVSKNRITQIYNPVDSDAMVSREYNKEIRKIISVGRLTYQKNYQLLIDIAKEVLPGTDWTWDIYGDGPDRNELESLIAKYHLGGYLNLKGRVDNMYTHYRDYSFLVMTSRYEGFPMTLLEASANRLPLIAFNVPTGPDEIIENGNNGFLIKASDKSDMKKAIKMLMSSTETRVRMSEEAFDKAATFRIDKIVDKWISLLDR